jgi:putative flippase GtrA
VGLAVGLYRKFVHVVRELVTFGAVGVISLVITTIGANVLHLGLQMGPITSVAISTIIAATFNYCANRYWTFGHRDNGSLRSGYVLFMALNGIGLTITGLFIGTNHYVLDNHDPVSFNIAQLSGTAVATAFRYWSYKKWVFPAPSPVIADRESGQVEGPVSSSPDLTTPIAVGAGTPFTWR